MNNVAAHPKMKKFMNKPIDNYDEMKECFDGCYATGDFAFSSSDSKEKRKRHPRRLLG